ncbi:G1 family glutamic endopeptidase [Streptomyces sp. STR69]|uniref:G1 family glutamic endopeptidase n=1 Tax=Streptomyces sp. STR69 TaxID=1796942 RepID=UPI0021C88ED3|nr:G1 family glutamic endopeptidase [Streptomyces sp. STR69]
MCIFLASLVLAAASVLFSASAAGAAPVLSADWSGYAAVGSYNLVQATWELPAVSCASGSQYSSVWVGLGGYNSSTVEQIGTEADCSNGTPVYYAWYQFYPDQRHTFSEPVHPGDELTAFSAYNAVLKNYDMGILDYTGYWSERPVGAASSPPPSSAEVIVGLPPCDNGCIPPLANFGTVSITEAQVNAAPLGNANPSQIIMTTGTRGRNKDTVSALSTNITGSDFTATWASAG